MNRQTAYLFDTDGTLTESSQVILNFQRNILLRFMEERDVWICSGSDYLKMKDQLTFKVVKQCEGIFASGGNDHLIIDEDENVKRVYNNDIVFSDELKDTLKGFLNTTKTPIKTGNHIDERQGLINFSTVGRNANREERDEYIKYDKFSSERLEFADILDLMYPQYDFRVAGETGIDIVEKGKDKSQIYDYLKNNYGYNRIVFFGDRCEAGGNDFPIAERLDKEEDKLYYVSNYVQTYNILEKIMNDEK